MDTITVKSYQNHKSMIQTTVSVKGSHEFEKMFLNTEFVFSLEYSVESINVPQSIGILPTICLLLPVAWIFDAKIICSEVDKSFYEALDAVKTGYRNMYPYINFQGALSADKLIDNRMEARNASLVMFSGGVDAFNTLASHYEERPDLLTIWGADIAQDNELGWKPVKEQLEAISSSFGLKYYYVRSNCRSILNEKELNAYLRKLNQKLNWWHDFQHGICIISHAAPLAYDNGYSIVYIASTFTANDIGNYTCASDPTIDNHVRFGSTRVVHDGYEFSRQDKIYNICGFRRQVGKRIPLRVCYESKVGNNCCRCEKCYRTILGILAEKEDPCALGFYQFNRERRKKMIRDIRLYKIPNYNFRYKYIQDRLRRNYSQKDCPRDLQWFYDLTIDPASANPFYKKIWRLKRKIMRGFTKVCGINW